MFNRKESSVLKKGRDGRNSCTSCHSVTEIRLACSGLSQSPIQKNSLRFCLCSSRVAYGYLFIVLSQRSVSITRFKVRIYLAFVHCPRSRSQAQYQATVVRIFTPSAFMYLCNLITVFWLAAWKFWFKFWKSESWKHYAITNFFFFCIRFCFKGGRGVRAQALT